MPKFYSSLFPLVKALFLGYTRPMIAYKRFRRFLFFTFVAAFGVTTAFVLFFALGYRYSFERGIFVYSGSITLKTIPQDVVVTVDDETLPNQQLGILNNSIHITGLMPGEHHIEVSAPGYLPWKRRAIVTSGQSTEFWNILLTREEYVATELPATEGTLRIFPGPRNNLFALAKQRGDIASLVLLNRDTGSAKELLATSEARFDTKLDPVSWSPSGTWIAVNLQGNHQNTTLLHSETEQKIDLNTLHPDRFVNTIEFLPNERNVIVYLVDHDLYTLDLAQEPLTPHLKISDIRTYTLSGDTLYFMHESTGALESFQASDSAPSPESAVIAPPVDFGSSPYILVAYDEDRIAILERSEKRRLFVYNHSPSQEYGLREIASNVADIQFSDDGKKLLFYSRNEINVYFFRPWEVQPERAENSILQVARFSDPITSPVWSEDYEHILFIHGKTVKIIELDHRDRRSLSDLVTFPYEPLSIMTSFGENLLYFTFADQSVLSFVFPEPQGLFGL